MKLDVTQPHTHHACGSNLCSPLFRCQKTRKKESSSMAVALFLPLFSVDQTCTHNEEVFRFVLATGDIAKKCGDNFISDSPTANKN